MKEILNKLLNKSTDFSGSTNRKVGKGILGVVIIVILGILGLELSGTDFDLGSLFSGNSLSESKLERDASGNIMQDNKGNFVTKLKRDIEGRVLPDDSTDGKYTDEYNCADFQTYTQAQTFYVNSGGVQGDTNRLDGDKDGEACESLPKK